MLDLFKTLFAPEGEPEAELDPTLAAAALMFEVVWADHDIDQAELVEMKHHLETSFDVDPSRLDTLVLQTKKLHDESVGLHEFTTALNDNVSPEKKKEVVAALWRIAFADRELTALEEHMVRRIADLLYVSHRDFISLKLSAKKTAEGS